MGPACEVTVTQISEALRGEVHRHLEEVADEVVSTRKGRVYDVRIEGRPIGVTIEDDSTTLGLAAGCNQPEDWQVLERLAMSLAARLGGHASKPEK